MNTDELVKKAQENLSVFQTRLETIQKLSVSLPAHLFETASIGSDLEDLVIRIPYSVQVFRDTRRAIGPGWKRIHMWGGDNDWYTYKAFVYANPDFPGIHLRITLDTSENGTTCHRVKTGEKVVSVYEVVCN